jgi:hypothetical protein
VARLKVNLRIGMFLCSGMTMARVRERYEPEAAGGHPVFPGVPSP